MLPLETLLEESLALHGHKCPGQVLGVRMARLGCAMLGIEEPKTNRGLIVYVEIDRCATDAIQAVTGCKLGRRTLKYIDLGKVAATFLDLGTDTAFRVVAKDTSRDAVWSYVDPGTDAKLAQFKGYQVMPDTELFDVMPVRVNIRSEDMPGRPIARVTCEMCGEGVNDRREVMREGRTLCISCVNGPYYVVIDNVGQ
jgi:formylmethanofuran dehydrogenase subunit E